MLTVDHVLFWLAGIASPVYPFRAVAKDTVDAILWQPPEVRRRLAQVHVRDALAVRDLDPGASAVLRLLAGLLLSSVRWDALEGVERVRLPEPVDGYTLVLVRMDEDENPYFYDEDGARIWSFTFDDKARILDYADRAKVEAASTGPKSRRRRRKRVERETDRERGREGGRYEEV
jgi:hypothetical protein